MVIRGLGKLGAGLRPLTPRRNTVSYYVGMLLAIIGATAILFALSFVTLVIGGLVNGMVALMSGPLVDRVLSRRERR